MALGDFIGSLRFYPWKERMVMPEEQALERAREDAREGQTPTTQAGEFVHEEIEHVRAGKHGARSAQQAIAIGLSKARRAGIKLPPPRRGSARRRRQAARDTRRGHSGHRRVSPRRSRAVSKALKRESRSTTSRSALSRQTRRAARQRRRLSQRIQARRGARTRIHRRKGGRGGRRRQHRARA
jgi:hypothetical protein